MKAMKLQTAEEMENIPVYEIEEEQQKTAFTPHFDDNHGVVISGANNDVVITLCTDGKMKVEQHRKQQEPTALPDELQTVEALELLDKLRDSGFLDNDYKPSGLSLTEKSVVAAEIANRLWKENRWKPIEDYWRVIHMSSIYNSALKQKKTLLLLDKLKKI